MMENITDTDREDMHLWSANCGYCGTKLTWKRPWKRTGKRTWNRRKVVHINICQEPSIIYFCSQECKLNWIFKSPDVELVSGIEGKWNKKEVKSTFDKTVIEENTEELEKYLKNNKIKILRQA